jgi:hypothetical protein
MEIGSIANPELAAQLQMHGSAQTNASAHGSTPKDKASLEKSPEVENMTEEFHTKPAYAHHVLNRTSADLITLASTLSGSLGSTIFLLPTFAEYR